ncbi:hypothetical protein GQR58_030472 [Nymphon striatum]|nr:hypothetical protein GQR58_030472 [Nymphon striatum]
MRQKTGPDDAAGSAELDGILGDLGAEVDNLDPETEADVGETLNSLVPASDDAQTSDESIEDILGALDAPETASEEVALDDILGELGGAEADDLDAMLGDLGPVDDETAEHDAPPGRPDWGGSWTRCLTEADDIADPGGGRERADRSGQRRVSAALLGRVARVAAHVDAPFFAAMSPQFLNSDKADRPRLVAEAWDELTEMAEAGHLGLVSPRFLLRRPYGAKTEPIYEFEFEEFTEAEGLRGMLWGNPVALVAILLGRAFTEHGKAMNLGSIMSLGEMPFHFILDRATDKNAPEKMVLCDGISAHSPATDHATIKFHARDDNRRRQDHISELGFAEAMTTGKISGDYSEREKRKNDGEQKEMRHDIKPHNMDFPEEVGGDAYAAIEKKEQYRSPLVTPWPEISGLHTATVVGQSGEEIWTDEHGRIKIQTGLLSLGLDKPTPEASGADEKSYVMTVEQNVTETVKKGDRTETVEMGDKVETIKQGDMTETIEMGDHKETVKLGNLTVDVTAGKIKMTAGMEILLQVGGSSVKIDNSGVTIKGPIIKVQGDAYGRSQIANDDSQRRCDAHPQGWPDDD